MKYRLTQIGEILGVDTRLLRYIVEQQIVSGIGDGCSGRGTARELTQRQARLIGVAAVLHDRGLRGDILKQAVRGVGKALTQGNDHCYVHLGREGTPVTLAVDIAFTSICGQL